MHKNSAVGFLLQLHEQIIIIFAALKPDSLPLEEM